MMMTTETTPMTQITHAGHLTIGDISIPCYVDQKQQRLISARKLQDVLKISEDKENSQKKGGARLRRFLDKNHIQSLIQSQKKVGLFSPIICQYQKKIIHGFNADTVIGLCDLIVEARNQNLLKTERQRIIGQQAEMLIRSVAKVGLVALIDEATGYEEDREHKALQKILKAYMSAELVAWAKRFPDEFYRQIFRLKGWNWDCLTKQKKPLEVGKITRDIVYKRLAPGVLEELEKRNPVIEQGYRKVRHHQYLNPDLGHPALSQHLHALICFMRACSNWPQFQRMVKSVFPLKDEQMHLHLEQFDKTRKN